MLFIDKFFEDSSAEHHFVDKIQFFVIFEHFDDLADIGVVEFLEQLDLSKEGVALAELQIFLAHDFDGTLDSRHLVRGSAHSAETTFTDDFVEFVVVFNVCLVLQVEVFLGNFNALAFRRLKGSAVLQHCFEILPRELDHVFGLVPDNFFHKVLEDSWELIRYFNLLGGEDVLLADVGHFNSNEIKFKL